MTRELVVFNNIRQWQVPVISRKHFVETPHLDFDLRIPLYPDIAVDKERSASIDKTFSSHFDAKFTSMSNDEFGKLQKAVDEIEDDLARKQKDPRTPLEEADIKARVAKFNEELKAAVTRWKAKVEGLAEHCYMEAVETLDKQNKAKLRRAKIVPVLKILLIAGLALTAAALAAFSGGGTVIIVAAAISALLTVYKAYRSLSDEVRNEAKKVLVTTKSVEADMKAVDKKLAAIVGDRIDQKSSAWQELGAAMVPLTHHLAELQTHRVAMHIKARKALEVLHAAEKKFPDLKGDSAAAKSAAECSALIRRADTLNAELAHLMDLEAKATEIQSNYKALVRPRIDGLGAALGGMARVVAGTAEVLGSAGSLLGEFKPA